MSVRTLFLGMDGSTFTILDELTKGDRPVMPFMAKIFQKGARAKLRSTMNPLTPPAWTTLMTGRTPGNHGLYDFLKSSEVDGELYTELYSATDCRMETIWSIASRQGRKIAALNFPFTAPPPRDLNGVILPGFVPWKHLRRNTHPQDFYTRLKDGLPEFNPKELAWDFDKEQKAVQQLTNEERRDWVSYHLPRELQWFNVAKYVQTHEKPDLMAVMFDGTDKLQHQVWRFIDPRLKEPDEQDEHFKTMRALALSYFTQLDTHVRDLVEAAGPDTQVFMASDHGFTAQREVVRINTFLKEKGYLKYKPILRDARDAPPDQESSFLVKIDLDKTTAYCRTPSSNGIHIRVARAPGQTGIPPEQYEAFRSKLIADLEGLVDEETGERIIAEVHTREKAFPGEAMDSAPDILLVLRDFGFVSIKEGYSSVEKLPEIIGTHHPDGVFIAYGPGIKSGAAVEGRNIADVAATLLYSLGLPVPEDFEGVMADSLFTPEHLREKPVVVSGKTVSPTHMQAKAMTGEDKDSLMRQLAALGYV